MSISGSFSYTDSFCLAKGTMSPVMISINTLCDLTGIMFYDVLLFLLLMKALQLMSQTPLCVLYILVFWRCVELVLIVN